MKKIKTDADDHTDAVALGVALTCAILVQKGRLRSTDFERVLNLLAKATLPFYDETFEAETLREQIFEAIHQRAGLSVFVIPVALGEEDFLSVTDLSQEDVGAASSLLRGRCSERLGKLSASEEAYSTLNIRRSGDKFDEECHVHTISKDVGYCVVTVPEVFSPINTTLIQGYCIERTRKWKKKVLIVVDNYVDSIVSDIRKYFQEYSSTIDDFFILSMQISRKCKDIQSMLKVMDIVLQLGMSRRDIIIVVGGGTLMDVVGFAAAIFDGGIPYVRIPTTLVGMIDAGVGAKVGVDFEGHKSLIGRYFPPVACCNDPRTFLVTLPQREFACGLAEAIKMAILHSPRLFEVIERYHRDAQYNKHTDILIHLSVRAMLEELQPNLYEHDLRRLADFGHEFGHIVESMARQEIPHGECVAIGMAISSFLAHRKGLLSRVDLQRILNCILDVGLPIRAPDNYCCDADVLWTKIGTEGIEHKDGMLWLVVPETIGRCAFLDRISDIDARMVNEAVLNLRFYTDQYKGGNALRVIESAEVGYLASKFVSIEETGQQHPTPRSRSLSNDDHRPSSDDKSIPITAAILGASGDVGSQLAGYLAHNGVRVICSVRAASLRTFERRTSHMNRGMRVLTGDVPDLANLRLIIREADVLYNMAAIVTLSSKPDQFAKILALNGLAQGVITHLIQRMGRDRDIKVIYPSSQRVHWTIGNTSVEAWIHNAAQAYFARQDELEAEHDISLALEQFAAHFIASHPLPAGVNVYDVSKRLGEYFVSFLPRHLSVRISGAYGPSFRRGFVYRAVNPSREGNIEVAETRDFIYIDDLNEILWKAAETQPEENGVFDGVSGESLDLRKVWQMVRELKNDGATVVFGDQAAQEELELDVTFASRLLQRDFMPLRLGLLKTVERAMQMPRQSVPVIYIQHPETFKSAENEALVPGNTILSFKCQKDRLRIQDGASPVTGILERFLNEWLNRLPTSHREVLIDYVSLLRGLCIRVRSDPAMTQIGGFAIGQDEQHDYLGYMDIHASLVARASYIGSFEGIEDVVNRMGHHLLNFLLRGRRPSFSVQESERERAMAGKWKGNSQYQGKPCIIVMDVGATYMRVGVMSPHGHLLYRPIRMLSPSKQSYPHDILTVLQGRLLDTLAHEVDVVRGSHSDVTFEEVGLSVGAVITRQGVVKDASILWGDRAEGYNLKNALLERLTGVRVTILNDVSAAAWRYAEEGRFCLITISSGMSNKVFNPDLRVVDRLDLDAAGVGGEMGHVVVEPRAVDALVQRAILQSKDHPEEFKHSRLSTYVHGDAQNLKARHVGKAAKEHDRFAVRLLEEANIPYCPCGNLADLCSYSSGRGALLLAQRYAARGIQDIAPIDINDSWLHQAIATGHPLALAVLRDSTYPLALRILQLAADIGLDKFIIVGGFAMKTGETAYVQALQDHLMHFYHQSAYFSDWSERKVRGLVKFGVDDDNDGLIGMGRFVQHLRLQFHAIEKAVGEQSLAMMTRTIPRCGAEEILAKVIFSGICTTDLQILCGERGLEPTVLGHEGVCQVIEVGRDVKGLDVGDSVILNPNNPLDDHDKLGHTREGVFQQYVKLGQEFLRRGQILNLGNTAISATDTLVEPLSCVIAAQNRIKHRIVGKNVLVIGAGLMGLLFVMMNAKMGARNVFLANRSEQRLDFAVGRRIAREQNVFVIGQQVSNQVDKVSVGEGVDVVIICVSLGQGVRAAQNAMTWVNARGCVYLFAGFRPGDVLTVDSDAEVDVWSIRSDWKTESIQYAGKPVDLSGHRGSRNEDLAIAADTIRRDHLSFGRVISHIVSLDMLPDIMLGLTRNNSIRGVPAKRVVVDMTARKGVIERFEELPLRHLREAVGKKKQAIPVGNLFREIGFEGNFSLLGWVHPPAWQNIKMTIEAALQMSSLNLKRHFIWVGTGAWVFLVDFLRATVPTSADITFHTLQSLDPKALVDLLTLIQDLSVTVCIGMSQSGKTLETVMLMNALRERFDNAGLDYREHFIWLTDTSKSVSHYKSGEAVIRSTKEHDWSKVDMIPSTFGSRADIDAVFCAPHSTLTFLSLIILLRRDWKAMQHMYQQYLALKDGIAHIILPQAYSVASNHIEHLQVLVDQSVVHVIARLVTQLIEQALGSKQAGFNPQAVVTSNSTWAGPGLIALPATIKTPAVVKMMLLMHSLALFVAAVAYHRRMDFVTHSKVNLYKLRAADLFAAPEIEQKVSAPSLIEIEIIAYLSAKPHIHCVEILCYWNITAFHQRSLQEWLTSRLASTAQGISVNVTGGEEWNHSRYQAAVQAETTVYVLLGLQEYCAQVNGISKGTVDRNTKLLRAISYATYETLLPKALHFRVGQTFPADDSQRT